MAIAYYATKLSENISRTDEGYLICRDAIIARTGFQEYRFRDLPQKQAAELGLKFKPDDIVNVYRSPEQVFRPQTMASFEGKPFCDDHPEKFLAAEATPDTPEQQGTFAIHDYQRGHQQNVRPGEIPLESGDMPLLCDVIVTHPAAIAAIESGKRELSCGYGYDIALRGNQIEQINIIGNHVALVRKGRAGPEARINDEHPQQIESSSTAVAQTEIKKEKPRMAVTDVIKSLFGRGLQDLAKNGDDPEKLADAALAYAALGNGKAHARDAADPETEKQIKHADDCPCTDCMDKRAKDKKSKDAKDAAEAKTLPEGTSLDVDFYWDSANQKAVPVRGSKGYSKKKAGDAGEEDKRSRFHGQLDKIMDAAELKEGEGEGAASDADIDELKTLLEDYFDEEEDEPQHSDDKKGKKGKDSAEIIQPFSSDGSGGANDAADVLNRLRPIIARGDVEAIKNAFSTEATLINGKGQRGSGKGRYGDAHAASSARSGRASDQNSADDQSAKLTAAYAARHGKAFLQEVK